MSIYQRMIRESMAASGHIGAADPRFVEAWMRVEHPSLDGLSPAQFTEEVTIAVACVAAGPRAQSEALAQSMGL